MCRGAISPTGGKESEYGALGEMLEAAASNRPVGFKLEVKDSISLAAGHSLLAQLPPSELSATWLRVIDSERAQKAIHIRNTSAITLPEGTLAIYLNGSFLGETMLPRMVSGDERLLFHGEELELELESEVVPRESLLRELRFLSDKSIQLFYRRKRDFAVTLRNRSEESQLIYADIGLPDRAAVDSKQGDFRIIRVKELDQPMLEIRLDKGGVFAQTLHVEDNFEKIDGPQNGVWQATKLDSELESILRKHQPPADLKIEPSVVEQIKKLREELAHLFARERALVAKKADLQAETTTIKSLRTSIAQGANLRRRARRELETQLLAHQQQELRLRAQVRELEQEIDGLYLKQPLISR